PFGARDWADVRSVFSVGVNRKTWIPAKPKSRFRHPNGNHHGHSELLMTAFVALEADRVSVPCVSVPPYGPELPEQPVRPAMVKPWFKARIARPDSVSSLTM